MTFRSSIAAPVLVVIAVLLLLLGAYVGAYFGLCEHAATFSRPEPMWGMGRYYSARWKCQAFAPAAWVESRVMRCQVILVCLEGDEEGFFRVVMTGDGD